MNSVKLVDPSIVLSLDLILNQSKTLPPGAFLFFLYGRIVDLPSEFFQELANVKHQWIDLVAVEKFLGK